MSAAATDVLASWCDLVRADLGGLPGICFTVSQARTLWGVDERTWLRVLQTLGADHFLVRLADDRYCRADQIDEQHPSIEMLARGGSWERFDNGGDRDRPRQVDSQATSR